MNKRHLPFSVLSFLVLLCAMVALTIYHIFHFGLHPGLVIITLIWSLYVLAVPAAHGSVWLGLPLKFIFRRSFYPEPVCWGAAVGVNIVTMLLAPELYHETVWTFMLYRILTQPKYWMILGVAAIGTWLPVLVKNSKRQTFFTLVRHIITLVGLFVLYSLTHQEFIILINASANG